MLKTCESCKSEICNDHDENDIFPDDTNNYYVTVCRICSDNGIYQILKSEGVREEIKKVIKTLCRLGNRLENNQDRIEYKIDQLISKICPDRL